MFVDTVAFVAITCKEPEADILVHVHRAGEAPVHLADHSPDDLPDPGPPPGSRSGAMFGRISTSS